MLPGDSQKGLSWLHREAELGGILGVALRVDQHKRVLLVVLDDAGHTAEELEGKRDIYSQFFKFFLDKKSLF